MLQFLQLKSSSSWHMMLNSQGAVRIESSQTAKKKTNASFTPPHDPIRLGPFEKLIAFHCKTPSPINTGRGMDIRNNINHVEAAARDDRRTKEVNNVRRADLLRRFPQPGPGATCGWSPQQCCAVCLALSTVYFDFCSSIAPAGRGHLFFLAVFVTCF